MPSFPKLPAHLAGTQAQGLSPEEPIAQFEIGSAKNFVYLILDWKSREAALVDPQKELTGPLNALKENGFTLRTILLTHTHWDHVAGLPELVSLYPEIPVGVHSDDRHRLSEAAYTKALFRPLVDGETLRLGATQIRVLHTPGHSAGECSFFIEKPRPHLLTGDTLFIRDCGRTDFEDGSNEEMFASLQKFRALPPETVILPGHHYKQECASTIARELEESPPFGCKSVEELAGLP